MSGPLDLQFPAELLANHLGSQELDPVSLLEQYVLLTDELSFQLQICLDKESMLVENGVMCYSVSFGNLQAHKNGLLQKLLQEDSAHDYDLIVIGGGSGGLSCAKV